MTGVAVMNWVGMSGTLRMGHVCRMKFDLNEPGTNCLTAEVYVGKTEGRGDSKAETSAARTGFKVGVPTIPVNKQVDMRQIILEHAHWVAEEFPTLPTSFTDWYTKKQGMQATPHCVGSQAKTGKVVIASRWTLGEEPIEAKDKAAKTYSANSSR